MEIIKEYAKSFAIISEDGKTLAYRSNQHDADICIKEYSREEITATAKELSAKRFILRTNTYSHSLGFLNILFVEAKKYFPLLEDHNVEVVKYAGRRYAKTFGIEFSSTADAPGDFNLIDNIELTY